jgi:anaerobic magnesium-protoporphyrin IX monomethyl ester cyclase
VAERPRLTLVRVNERSGVHPFLSESNVSGIYPPLGIAYLAASARRAGFPTSLIDAHASDLSTAQIVLAIRTIGPDVVGLTSTTFNWPVVARLARRVRAAMPGIPIWVGGPQLALYPEECLTEQAVDLAVVGEGDETVVELLQRLAAGEELDGVAGTVARRGGELVHGPPRAPVADLDSLPMPAIDLLPMARYRSLDLPSPFVSMVTSRGCPFRCRYCSQVYVGGMYRSHGPARVVAEMVRARRKFGAREIVFFDETFTLERDWVFEVCERILAADLDVPWNVRTRVDRLDRETLVAMHEAGCISVHVGIESGSPRVQKLMNKNLDLSGIGDALQGAREIGMETRGYFLIGYPGETREEIGQTIQLACDLPLDWASFTVTTPLPRIGITEDALADGRMAVDYWREYTLGRVGEPPGYFTSDELSAGDLEGLLQQAYRRFYLRPSLLGRKAKTVRLWQELPSIARTLRETRMG